MQRSPTLVSPAEDGQEGPLRFLQSHGKVVQLLLHQEAGRLLGQVDAHHGAVGRRRPQRVKRRRRRSINSGARGVGGGGGGVGSPVGSVSRAEGVVDVDVAQFGQGRPEGVDLLLGSLSLSRWGGKKKMTIKHTHPSLLFYWVFFCFCFCFFTAHCVLQPDWLRTVDECQESLCLIAVQLAKISP